MPREKFSRGHLAKSTTRPQKWLGDWYIYRDGKRVHRGPKVLGKCSEMSKSEAQAELDRRILEDRAAADQKPAEKEEITVAWLFKHYRDLKVSSWADATREFFDWITEKRIVPAIGSRSAAAITRADLQAFLDRLAEDQQSRSQIKHIKTYLNAVFIEAVEEDIIAKNPARKLEVAKNLPPKCNRYLTEVECQKLLAVTHGRDHLILRLCMVCGFRPSELFALRRDDVEPGQLRIDETVREGKIRPYAKTEASIGYVSVPPSLELEIRAYLESVDSAPDALLFPNERGGVMRQANYVKRNIPAIAKQAGIHGVNFQSLRRTTATHGQKTGTVKDVQAMMRHSTPAMTVGVYMQSLPDSVRKAVEELDATLTGGTIQ